VPRISPLRPSNVGTEQGGQRVEEWEDTRRTMAYSSRRCACATCTSSRASADPVPAPAAGVDLVHLPPARLRHVRGDRHQPGPAEGHWQGQGCAAIGSAFRRKARRSCVWATRLRTRAWRFMSHSPANGIASEQCGILPTVLRRASATAGAQRICPTRLAPQAARICRRVLPRLPTSGSISIGPRKLHRLPADSL
jgi:hypothetical protein